GLEGWDSPTTMLGLKIPQRVLDRELEVLLGRTPEAPVVFAGSLDLASRSGREWRSTVEFLAQGLQARESMLGHPLVSGPAAQAVVRGLLLVAPNSYTAELTGDVAAAGPTYVRRAVAFIEDNADQPLTLEQIAEAANISPRALQTGFRTHLESTPISVLRDVRLRRVHADLLAAAPTDLVSTVARRWGFMHVGRFAIHYAQTFGQSPSETLRNSTKF
ncbi:MAG: AraC family transcriptional regulator, partial [Arthrobacter sp.]|uniref:helix-turn-helix transcriptional regulator n=1 Tax=Arthrobacter sp. TaxID=1667 RepID=UPI00348CF1B5